MCTGAAFRGPERAGDVLAAAAGLAAEDGAPAGRPLVLAGWSHGGWAAADLMTMPLAEPGEAGLADPSPAPMADLKGLYMAYPYAGIGSLSRCAPWRRAPRALFVAPRLDHVTSPLDAARLHATARAAGCAVEVWTPQATHSFDEPTGVFPMRCDPVLTRASVERFAAFLGSIA